MGSRICCICANEDTDENLHAAGMYHALKSDPNHKHAQTLTEKLLEMALGVGNQFLANRVVFGNAAANELFYHSNCYKNLVYEYSKLNRKSHEEPDVWTKAIALNRIVDYLYQSELERPGIIYRVRDLEKMYIEDLDGHGIQVHSHVTRFAEKLSSSIDGLVVKTQAKVTTVCFSSTIDELYWEHSQGYVKRLREVVEPIRTKMLKTENKFEVSNVYSADLCMKIEYYN